MAADGAFSSVQGSLFNRRSRKPVVYIAESSAYFWCNKDLFFVKSYCGPLLCRASCRCHEAEGGELLEEYLTLFCCMSEKVVAFSLSIF